jgi:thioredoxin-like negative regulator of GroEL
MNTASPEPTLLFLYSSRCGFSRRADALLAHVLQRGRNHERFSVRKIDLSEQPALAERLGVRETPAVWIVVDRRVVARLTRPTKTAELVTFLRPWLEDRTRPPVEIGQH